MIRVQPIFGAASNRGVGVLFALPEEAAPFLRHFMEMQQHYERERCAQNNMPFVKAAVLSSGTGVANACEAVHGLNIYFRKHILEEGLPDPLTSLIICGFAGGLGSDIAAPDLIIGESVVDYTRGRLSAKTYKPDAVLLDAAKQVNSNEFVTHHGLIATTHRVLVTKQEKQSFAEKTKAQAVDMETAGAAQVAEEYGIPWLAVRVITDGVGDDMPLDFNALADANGNVDKKRVIAATLAHPWKIPGLIRLGTRSQQAAKNLGLFLEAFLKALPDINT